MSMATDDERREVAARLRGIKDTREGCGHELCCDLWDAIFNCGYRCTDLCDECEAGVIDSLADLIDPDESGQNQDTNPDTVQKESPAVQIAPECDRDALLALADEMTVEKGDIWRWSSRIREALGVRDD